jgi:hypothetical protein
MQHSYARYGAGQNAGTGTHTPLPLAQQVITAQISPGWQSELAVHGARPSQGVKPSTQRPPPSAVVAQTGWAHGVPGLQGMNVSQVAPVHSGLGPASQVQAELQVRNAPSGEPQGLPGGSQSSPGSTIPLPHSGQVQSALQGRNAPPGELDGQVRLPGGSHCSPGLTTLSPQRGGGGASQGNVDDPVVFWKFARRFSHDGRGWVSQSWASQKALQSPYAAPVSPLQASSLDGGAPSRVFATDWCV